MSAESDAIRGSRAGSRVGSGGSSSRRVIQVTSGMMEVLAAAGYAVDIGHDAALATGLEHADSPAKEGHQAAGLDASRLAEINADTLHKDLESLAEIDLEKRKESDPTSNFAVPERDTSEGQ